MSAYGHDEAMRDLHYLKALARRSCDHEDDYPLCDCAGADRLASYIASLETTIAALVEAGNALDKRLDAVDGCEWVEQIAWREAVEGVSRG